MLLVKMLIVTILGNFPDKALPEQQNSGALLTVSWAAEKTSWPNSEPWVAGYSLWALCPLTFTRQTGVTPGLFLDLLWTLGKLCTLLVSMVD